MPKTRKPKPRKCTLKQIMADWRVAELTIDDLANELARRSVGLLLVTVSLDDAGSDVWRASLKGSPLLLTSCLTAADSTVKIRIAEIAAAQEGNR